MALYVTAEQLPDFLRAQDIAGYATDTQSAIVTKAQALAIIATDEAQANLARAIANASNDIDIYLAAYVDLTDSAIQARVLPNCAALTLLYLKRRKVNMNPALRDEFDLEYNKLKQFQKRETQVKTAPEQAAVETTFTPRTKPRQADAHALRGF